MSTPYYSDEFVTLHMGDCIEVMRGMPDASVDAIVTDPPYGINYLGNQWDRPGSQRRNGEAGDLSPQAMKDFQGWCEEWAAEGLRVLKPGAHIVAFGGTRTWHRLTVSLEIAGFEIRNSIAWLFGSGMPKGGDALKPLFEPIVVARKPPVGTVSANILAHGTGGLNIEAARVVSSDDDLSGRWPPNVVLDEEVAGALDATAMAPSRQKTAGKIRRSGNSSGFGGGWGEHEATYAFDDTDDRPSKLFPVFRWEPKAKWSGRPSYATADGQVITHPTTKPLDLMRWLVRLVTPPGGTVLEPFAGSGTTAEACVIEGFKCIAIEREAAYLPLIEKRLNKPIAMVLDFTGEAS